MGPFFRSAFFLLPFALWFFALPPALGAQSEDYRFFPGDTIEETEGRGLAIHSNPGGARVFIDGIERGVTPLYLDNLGAGRYFVRVEKDGYTDRRFRVSVRRGSVVNVSVELKEATGRVLLRIRRPPEPEQLPFDPEITVDGQSRAELSYGDPVLELPAGFRTILVRAFGWEDSSATFYVEDGSLRELVLNPKPAVFRLSGAGLSRERFNPANAGSLGTTALNFEVSAPGTGSLTVLGPEGKPVFVRALGPFKTWAQSAVWDGRNAGGEIQGDGLYTLVLKAASLPGSDSPPVEETLLLSAEIDSSRVIHPLTSFSGKSGLLFAPLPSLLPPGSFQIEGSLLAGSPPAAGGLWKSLPFAASARFSPLESLEVSAAFNVIPFFENSAAAGAGGGAKWVFLKPSEGNMPFGAAAGAVFSWTGKTGLTPFAMASGIEVFFPFSLDFGKRFSFALTPAALWTGDKGFPWEGIPRLLVSGGFLARFSYVIAGLSFRSEYNFSGEPWPPSLMAGAEIKIFPPPSSFVISVMGGAWLKDKSAGAFGGIGIGMIH